VHYHFVRIAAILTCVCVLSAGEMETRMAESIARMQAGLEKQRASVRHQAAAHEANGSFFVTPWLSSPVDPASPAARVPAASFDCEPVSQADLRTFVTEAAIQEGVNPMLIQAIVRRESAAYPCAVSPKGAQGLMQLMPATAADLGVADVFDARQNLMAGARYLKQMLDRYKGDLRLALAAYNAGPQRVSPGGSVPGIPETQAYVAAILGQLEESNKEIE
jgi:soluble lytic murein transglycosylase-like protein